MAQDVANNLFEIGQSAVKGTAGAVADIAHETIEQVGVTPAGAVQSKPQTEQVVEQEKEQRKIAAKSRLEEVRSELAQFSERKLKLDTQIKNEEAAKEQQGKAIEQKKKDSWVNKMINRSQTTTEKGRMME